MQASIKTMARQGDVLTMRAKLPSRTLSRVKPESGREVLAHGEATGHHHSFAMSDRIARFRDDGAGGGGGLYFSIADGTPAILAHQEHTAIPHSPGEYRAIRQRVFQAGMAQRVTD